MKEAKTLIAPYQLIFILMLLSSRVQAQQDWTRKIKPVAKIEIFAGPASVREYGNEFLDKKNSFKPGYAFGVGIVSQLFPFIGPQYTDIVGA